MRSSTPIDLHGMRMLVGEHDLDRRTRLSLMLEQQGIDIVEARTGTEIVHALATAGPFDAVIGDVDLPTLSGRDLATLLRGAELELPLLLVGAARPLNHQLGAIPLTAEAVLPALRRLLTVGDDADDDWLDRYHDDGGSD